MIISRTPFRLSFFGGGWDFPVFYHEQPVSVLSTSIDKYCYVNCRYLPPFFAYNYRIRYRKNEDTATINEIKHPTVRECLKFMNIKRGVEIQHNADLPAMSGLGSSSAFTVGLLHALNALNGKMIGKQKLALDAIHVEQDLMKDIVGSQDQTITAYGGFNKITFNGNDISVNPVIVSQDNLELLQSHLMLFFTGFTRLSSKVASTTLKNTRDKKDDLNEMVAMVDSAIQSLSANIMDFGILLRESWKIKRSLAKNISNQHIDDIFDIAMKNGAIGGKLLGAGGGGFVLFFVEPHLQQGLRNSLGLLHVPFRFDNTGSQIIYYNPETNY